MSLWWLEPGWKSAVCGCGANIWDSGGDPDMGRCYDCVMGDAVSQSEQRRWDEMAREQERQNEAEYEEYLRAEQTAAKETP